MKVQCHCDLHTDTWAVTNVADFGRRRVFRAEGIPSGEYRFLRNIN